MSCRLGIDVGGTFTDLLVYNEQDGALQLLKTPTTTDNHLDGVARGIERFIADGELTPGDIDTVHYRTTAPAGMVLKGRGAKVGLLVTKDFEQVLHLAHARARAGQNGQGPETALAPLADLECTRGVLERVNARGEEVTPLDEAAARQAVQELIELGVSSIAISLLNAYASPVHERRLRAIVREIDDDMPVFLSSETRRECGEDARTLTTVLNAYATPSAQRDLAQFEERLQGLGCNAPIRIVRSDGGVMNAGRAAAAAAQTIASGSATGVSVAARIARQAGISDALTVDMGGTSTDLSLVRDGEAIAARETDIGGLPLKALAVDVHRSGAGGGAIAHVPVTGALRVGPDGVGAMPGPACYGRGGDRATVTDANAVLGRLPDDLLGGGMTLDLKAAEEAVGRVARQLDVETHRAAQGIVDIANEHVAGALRRIAVEQGIATSNVALMVFGGAGPLHGAGIAALTGSYPVVVPPNAGGLSALGCLQSDVRSDFVQAVMRDLAELSDGRVAEMLAKLEGYVRDELGAEGVADGSVHLTFEADLRYAGQSHELALKVARDALSVGGLQDLAEQFAALHERLHGYRLDQPIELLNLRAAGTARTGEIDLPRHDLEGEDPAAAMLGQRRVYFDGAGVNADVYDRQRLRAGNALRGPAMITQMDSTTVVPPNHTARIDAYLNILIVPDGPSA